MLGTLPLTNLTSHNIQICFQNKLNTYMLLIRFTTSDKTMHALKFMNYVIRI